MAKLPWYMKEKNKKFTFHPIWIFWQKIKATVYLLFRNND